MALGSLKRYVQSDTPKMLLIMCVDVKNRSKIIHHMTTALGICEANISGNGSAQMYSYIDLSLFLATLIGEIRF